MTDAVSAHFLLQDLQQKLNTVYTPNQLKEVAQGITTIRNRRYLDTRFGQIDQLTMLDSVLKANGLKQTSDNEITYFTTLNDNWRFAERQGRGTGRRITRLLTLQGTIYSAFDRFKNSNQSIQSESDFSQYSKTRANTQSLTPSLEYQWIDQTQLNMNTERYKGFSAKLGSSLTAVHSQEGLAFDDYPELDRDFDPSVLLTATPSLYAFWGYLYQPNSRNTLNMRTDANLAFYSLYGENIRLLDPSTMVLTADLGGTATYYHWFNQHIAMRADASLRYTNTTGGIGLIDTQNSDRTNGIDYTIFAGLTYQLY